MYTAGWQCYSPPTSRIRAKLWVNRHLLILFQITAPIQGNREWICACRYRWCK